MSTRAAYVRLFELTIGKKRRKNTKCLPELCNKELRTFSVGVYKQGENLFLLLHQLNNYVHFNKLSNALTKVLQTSIHTWFLGFVLFYICSPCGW